MDKSTEILNDIYDVLAGNTSYITQDEFMKNLYEGEVNNDNNIIRLVYKGNTITLKIEKEGK